MESIFQGAQFTAIFVFLLACIASLSVRVAMDAGRLPDDLPLPLRFASWGRHLGNRPSPAGSIVAVALMACIQIVPAAVVFAPSERAGIPARLAALGFVVIEVAWFAYLRRHMARRR